jgi:hypothetical protein
MSRVLLEKGLGKSAEPQQRIEVGLAGLGVELVE